MIGATVLKWTCGIGAAVVARYVFDAPGFLAGIVGAVAYYVLPLAVLWVGMRVSRSVIERSPDGKRVMAAHDAEQTAARRELDDLMRRKRAGERVDPAAVARCEGILFGNEGVLLRGDRPAPTTRKAPLVPISTDSGKRGPTWMESNVGPEFAVYFRPRPGDAVWGGVTEENATAYQLWFQRMVLRGKLHTLHMSDQVTDEIGAVLVGVANEALETHHLSCALLLLLAHQFVDADQMMRGLNTTTWVAKMVERDNCAPSPESYVEYLKERYFTAPA